MTNVSSVPTCAPLCEPEPPLRTKLELVSGQLCDCLNLSISIMERLLGNSFNLEELEYPNPCMNSNLDGVKHRMNDLFEVLSCISDKL